MRRLPASAPATHDGCGARLQKALDKSVKSGKPTTGDVKVLLKLVDELLELDDAPPVSLPLP